MVPRSLIGLDSELFVPGWIILPDVSGCPY